MSRVLGAYEKAWDPMTLDASSQTLQTTLLLDSGLRKVPMLLERYQIRGIIGQGGMGTVFKGYHLNLKREVAIKTLRVDRVTTPHSIRQFRQEMALVGQMDHPNVVRATDAGEKNGVFYLVMEFLAGCDLNTLLARRGPLNHVDACEIVHQAALGLEYIHHLLVHRDIKPSNLMLTLTGRLKILDLGLARGTTHAKQEAQQPSKNSIMGTYAYMAPEQAESASDVSGRADIYSLGCTFFKLLTGNTPYSGPDYDNIAKQLYGHRTIPLHECEGFARLPDFLKPILLRMTQKKPEDRYPSAREVAEALAPFGVGSNLRELVEAERSSIEAMVRPLSLPYPDELSRLTVVDTSPFLAGSVLPDTVATTKPRGQATGKRFRALAIALVLAAPFLAMAGWVLPPGEPSAVPQGLLNAVPKGPLSVRPLDELQPNQFHQLLDRQPIPIGCELLDPAKWYWDRDRDVVEAKGTNHLLFQLGETNRTDFTLETSLEQAPWTGNVGFFWGYREDAAAKQAKVPLADFATFQLVEIYRDVGPSRETRFWLRRGRASLRYNAKQTFGVKVDTNFVEPIRLRTEETFLRVVAEGKALKNIRLGEQEILGLVGPGPTTAHASDPWTGPLGVFTFSHSVVFRNTRILFQSAP